jgi:hypothetical protein
LPFSKGSLLHPLERLVACGKFHTWLKSVVRDKYTSLFLWGISDGEKRDLKIVTWSKLSERKPATEKKEMRLKTK